MLQKSKHTLYKHQSFNAVYGNIFFVHFENNEKKHKYTAWVKFRGFYVAEGGICVTFKGRNIILQC